MMPSHSEILKTEQRERMMTKFLLPPPPPEKQFMFVGSEVAKPSKNCCLHELGKPLSLEWIIILPLIFPSDS